MEEKFALFRGRCMRFNKLDDSIDELFLCHFGCFLTTHYIALVYPYPPLKAMIDHDHTLSWLKNAKDVDQKFKADQNFFQKIDNLWDWQHLYVLQCALDILIFGSHFIISYLRMS